MVAEVALIGGGQPLLISDNFLWIIAFRTKEYIWSSGGNLQLAELIAQNENHIHHMLTIDYTRYSAIADKPRDAFVQNAIA